MAGSYSHINNDGGMFLIENMGDAAECIEELFYLVRAHLSENEIKQALDAFYRFERGEADPSQPDVTGYGRAYTEAKEMLNK